MNLRLCLVKWILRKMKKKIKKKRRENEGGKLFWGCLVRRGRGKTFGPHKKVFSPKWGENWWWGQAGGRGEWGGEKMKHMGWRKCPRALAHGFRPRPVAFFCLFVSSNCFFFFFFHLHIHNFYAKKTCYFFFCTYTIFLLKKCVAFLFYLMRT